MSHGSSAEVVLERGVHFAAYRSRGCRVLLAIDSHGDCIRRVRLGPEVDETIARAFLQGLLDHDDPQDCPPPRHLQLVKPSLPSRPAPRPWRFWLPRLGRKTRIP